MSDKTSTRKFLDLAYNAIEDAIKDRKLSENFAVVLRPSCDQAAIFTFSDAAQDIMEKYSQFLCDHSGFTCSYSGQKNKEIYETLLTVPEELIKRGLVVLSITAAQAAEKTGITASVNDYLFIGPKIEWEVEESWALKANTIIPKESLELYKTTPKYIPKDLISLCKPWDLDEEGDLILKIDSENHPKIYPQISVDDISFDESFKENYMESIGSLMRKFKNIINPEWLKKSTIQTRFEKRIYSENVGEKVECEQSDYLTGLNDIPGRQQPQKQSVEIRYDTKIIEEMGIDELFFHRLLR